MPSVIVVGGGLAGLAAAAALASADYTVDLYESRPYLGGRATSYAISTADGGSETIDNCQHVLLRCCVNLIDLYSRLDVLKYIHFHKEFYFIEPGGRISILRRGLLPAPAHFTESFLKLDFLDLSEKLALARALLALRNERKTRRDLHRITMSAWLREKGQPERVIDRFWRQILVSAINEDLDNMAATHGFQVFWLGFLATSDAYEMGVPCVALGQLYSSQVWDRWRNIRVHLRSPVTRVRGSGVDIGGTLKTADYYVVAVPFERAHEICPSAPAVFYEHSPITGIHLWFEDSITELPHATLLDRTIQWMFNKHAGRYIQLVVSASRSLLPMTKEQIVDMASKELADFFPSASRSKLRRAHVVKEVRATFSAKPGLTRPGVATAAHNIFVAGDWTDSGWPATMEGAVRSGYRAAEAIAQAAGSPQRFVLPDIA
jgi:zeta-carotene desaturase